jgi:hypothetical protein
LRRTEVKEDHLAVRGGLHGNYWQKKEQGTRDVHDGTVRRILVSVLALKSNILAIIKSGFIC